MSAHDSHIFIETLAWTLIHFLWQGAMVAVVLWLVMIDCPCCNELIALFYPQFRKVSRWLFWKHWHPVVLY